VPTLRFTKDNWPTPEEYRRLLRETMFAENPIDDLLDLAGELNEYERCYNMSSEDFWARFQRGELGDDMDFIGWAGAYDLFHKRKVRSGGFLCPH